MDRLLDRVLQTFSGEKRPGDQHFWVDDSKCKACYECETAFSVFVRRHHCRICGRIFCGTCTNNFIPASRDSPDRSWLRVCNYCGWRALRDRAGAFVQPLSTQRGRGSRRGH